MSAGSACRPQGVGRVVIVSLPRASTCVAREPRLELRVLGFEARGAGPHRREEGLADFLLIFVPNFSGRKMRRKGSLPCLAETSAPRSRRSFAVDVRPATCVVQRAFALLLARVDVGARVQEDADDLVVPLAAAAMRGVFPRTVPRRSTSA